MAKDAYYFTHDYNARNDEKILELRSRYDAQGYGVFWMVIESMAENENGGVKASLMGGLSKGYGVAKEWLSKFFEDCVEIGLFYQEDGFFYSKRLLTHKEFRKGLSENGRRGALKKWGGYGHPNAKERKGKEIKGIEFKKGENAVLLSDGTLQKLGESQMTRLKFDDIKPEEITKGYVV